MKGELRAMCSVLLAVFVFLTNSGVSYAQSRTISLKQGRNFIATILTPADDSAGSIFASNTDIFDVWKYDPADPSDPWKHFRPGASEYSDLTEIDPLEGYWVDAVRDTDLTVTGRSVADDISLSLEPGWNAVVWPYDYPSDIRIGLAAAGLEAGVEYRQVSKFNNDTKRQENFTGNGGDDFNTFEPGGVYMMYMTADADITLENEQAAVEPSLAPVAVIAPLAGASEVGDSVSFDGSGSFDLDGGSIVSWRWDFGDGGTASGASAAHTFGYAGDYEVLLTVTDDDGLQGMDVLYVSVGAGAPVEVRPVSAGYDLYSVFGVGGGYVSKRDQAWTAYCASTPEYKPVSSKNGYVGQTGGVDQGSAIYNSGYVYKATFDLSEYDLSAYGGAQLRIGYARPDGAWWGSLFEKAPHVHQPVTLCSGSASALIEAGTTSGTVALPIDVPSGQNYTVTVSCEEFQKVNPVPETDPAATSTFDAWVQVGIVLDLIPSSSGNPGGNVAPVASFTYTPSSPRAGDEVTFDASASTDDGSVTGYAWTFGDNASASGVTVAHAFESPGLYEVVLRVRDDQGRSGATHKTITILPSELGDPRDPNALVGDPVNITNGNLVHHVTDRAVADRGALPLAFTRTYNGRDERSGVLGAGWSFNYGVRVAERSDGAAELTDEDGSRLIFTSDGAGGYTPPAGVFSVLVRNPDDTWHLTLKHGLQYGFLADGRLSSVVDRNGNEQKLTYDSLNRLTQVTGASGDTITVTYNTDSRIASVAFPGGRTFRYDYAGEDLIAVTDASGHVERYAYNAAHRLIVHTDPDGRHSYFRYDGNGRISETYGEAGTLRYTFAWEPDIRRTTVTDARGNATVYDYNAHGMVERITDAAGNSRTFAFDSDLNRVSATDELGNTTALTYDSRGNVTSISDATGNVTSFTWSAYDLPATVTDAEGNTTTFACDARGNLTGITDAVGNTRSFVYDAYGNCTGMTDAAGNASVITYTSKGRLSAVTDALGNTVSFTYDAAGDLTARTDDAGNATAYTYDMLGRPLTVTAADGARTEFVYDGAGHRASVTDAAGNSTAYAYDPAGRRIRSVYPDASRESLAYDLAGNLIVRTDRAGKSITFAYDALNRLTKKTYSDATEVSYGYDKAGRLTSATGAEGSTTFTWDAAGRLTTVGYPGARSISYAYDKNGNRTGMTYPDGTVVNYTYDELNRLTAVKQGTTTLATYSYDNLSRRTALSYGNGTSLSYAYDKLNRLTNITNPSVFSTPSYTYTCDTIGNRTGMTTAVGKHTYTYDNIYQLTGVDYPTGHFAPDATYAYDALGNRTNAEGKTWAANALNQYTAIGTGTLIYDAAGNLKTYNGWTYTYDAENRMTGAANGTTTANYEYDAIGRRISKTVGTSKTVYLYDGAQVIAEYGGSGTLLRKFLYGPGIDEPIAMIVGSNTYYYHFDGLGSVVGLTDSTGAKAEEYSYDVWGRVDKTSTIGNPYLFTGRCHDPETGLYYYRARMYSSNLGRFLQPDPLGYFDSMNLYGYCSNSPLNFVDPLGLCERPWWEGTLQIGVSGVAGASGAGTLGLGFVFGLSDEYGFQLGVYGTMGGGVYAGGGAELVIDVTFSSNTNISALSGPCSTIGGSAGPAGTLKPGVTYGGEVNIPKGNNARPSYTFSGGVGVGTPEGHAFHTETGVMPLIGKRRR